MTASNASIFVSGDFYLSVTLAEDSLEQISMDERSELTLLTGVLIVIIFLSSSSCYFVGIMVGFSISTGLNFKDNLGTYF